MDRNEDRTGFSIQKMAEENAKDRSGGEFAPSAAEPGVSTHGEDEGSNWQEEVAAEMTPPITQGVRVPSEHSLQGEEVAYREQLDSIEKGKEEAEEGGRLLGWAALVLSLLSLFFLPVLMASAGIVAGFFAYRGGSRTLGLWAIGIGLFSLIISYIFTPFLVRF